MELELVEESLLNITESMPMNFTEIEEEKIRR